MYDRILVPTDGSEAARRAGEHAAFLAHAFDADVHALSVVNLDALAGPFDAGGIDPQTIETYEAAAHDQLEALVDAIDREAVHTEVVHGHPATGIVDYAADADVDMIAMGTHGRTGVERYVVGSVTERVLRTSPVPVFTTRAGPEEDEPITGYEDVLVPTDGSERAAAAIEHGVAVAEAAGARLHAVSVVDEPDRGDAGLARPADLQNDVEAEAATATEAVAERGTAAGLETVTAVRQGVPAEELLSYVEEAGVDLVAMGTQGRTGLSRYLLGSTTERIVRHAPVPVLAVNARDREGAPDA